MKHFLLLMTLFFCLAPLSALAVQPGDLLPEINISTVGGQTINSTSLHGEKPLLLVFWASWCPSCKEEIGPLNALYDEFKGRMVLLGINVGVNDSEARVKKYVARYKVKYPQYFDEGSLLTRRFGVSGTPTIIIVDRQGVVQYKGHRLPTNLREHFDKL